MLNYWLEQKSIKIVACKVYEKFMDVDTSLGNRFRCRVENGMLGSGRLSYPLAKPGMDDLISEKEWEMVERYAEEMFFAAGLLKEKVWT